jgi:hypothetical protein
MIEFEFLDGARAFRRQPYPARCVVDLLWNDVSTATLTFDDDSDVWDVLDDDTRVRVHRSDEVLMTGALSKKGGKGPVGQGTIVFADDFADLKNLGWPNPAAAITAQTAEFARYTGPVETVVKAVAAGLSARLGYGWTIPPSTGLGSPRTVRAEFRMHPLFDRLVELVKAERLTWSLIDGVMDVTRGKTHTNQLTVDSGLIESYEWEYTAPTATRVIVGDGESGTSRTFGRFIDTAREAQWKRIREVFKDAGTSTGQDLATDAAEVLASGAPTAAVSVDLNEGEWFQYGEYHLGDLVPLKLGSLETTDVISQVTFTDDPENGETVKPHIGTLQVSQEGQLMAAISKMARGLRAQGRR